jgi:hypothetical protein
VTAGRSLWRRVSMLKQAMREQAMRERRDGRSTIGYLSFFL